jgi:hypothetical protein
MTSCYRLILQQEVSFFTVHFLGYSPMPGDIYLVRFVRVHRNLVVIAGVGVVADDVLL